MIFGEDDRLAIGRERPIAEHPAATAGPLPLALLAVLEPLIDADLTVAVLPTAVLDHLLLTLLVDLLVLVLPVGLVLILVLVLVLVLAATLTLALLLVPLFFLATDVLAVHPASTTTAADSARSEEPSERSGRGLAELGEGFGGEVVFVAEFLENEADLCSFFIQDQALDCEQGGFERLLGHRRELSRQLVAVEKKFPGRVPGVDPIVVRPFARAERIPEMVTLADPVRVDRRVIKEWPEVRRREPVGRLIVRARRFPGEAVRPRPKPGVPSPKIDAVTIATSVRSGSGPACPEGKGVRRHDG